MNKAYGFAFTIPAGWDVEEVAGGTTGDGVKLSNAVILSQGKFRIAVQFLKKSEPAQVGWDGSQMPVNLFFGDSVLGDKVTVLGIETHKRLWVYDEELKAVFVEVISDAADLVLHITLADGSTMFITDAETEEIPDSALAALDQVLGSLETR